MPGKTSQSSKKQDSKERLSSSQLSEAGRKISIWPEWTEAELAAEKWELGGGKGKEKGKPSQAAAALYEDPDGILLPSSLTGDPVTWKRPADPDVTLSEVHVIVEDPSCKDINLVSANAHLLHSELMCSIVSQIQALWAVRHCLPPSTEEGREDSVWRPWDHIHPHTKALNSMGKYCVKLYWMGSWRKITVDDQLPFTERQEGDTEKKSYTPLLPQTPNRAELWPAILIKAILKVAALDYSGGSELCEYGECDVTHMLTGWVPEVFPIREDPGEHIWAMLRDRLPVWRREPGSSEQPHRDAIILANFVSSHTSDKAILPSVAKEIATSEKLLKQSGILTPDYDLQKLPSYPVLLTQLREEPLEPPPKHPPPPKLQQPYYLGLKHRRPLPGALSPPPPSLEPATPRFLEIGAIATTAKRSEQQSSAALTDGSSHNVTPVPTKSSETASEVVRKDERSNESISKTDSSRVWMDYMSFAKAFTSICVFRNPTSFAHQASYSDLSKTVENSALAASTAPMKKTTSTAQFAATAKPVVPVKDNNILFVDSVKPVEIQLVFSSLSNWREGHKNLKTTSKPSLKLFKPPPLHMPQGGDSQQSSEVDQQPSHSSSEERKYVMAGSLVLQPYSWRSLQHQLPTLRVATSGILGAKLALPAGRHVFKLHATTPLGHHLELFSASEFVLCDEDSIFTHLSKESCRYMSFCSDTVNLLLSAAEHFSDEQKLCETVGPLVQLCREQKFTANNIKVMLASLLQTFATHAEEYGLTTTAMQFAWKAFLSHVFQHLEATATTTPDQQQDLTVAAIRRSLVPREAKAGGTKAVPERWSNRSATREEEKAAGVIQRSLQHHVEQKLQRARSVGSEEHTKVVQELLASLSVVQSHAEDIGLSAFNSMFKMEPELMERFPFFKDELTRAFHCSYSGTVPPLQPNTWTVLFREVFSFSEAQLLVPQFSCPVSTCRLRVIDNDSGLEMPCVFHCIAPYVYQPNNLGYTLMAEVWSMGEGVEGGRWSVRLVSSSPQLPQRISGEGDEISTTFLAQELQDYALPDREGKLFRYILNASEQCSISVQLTTSKQDAYIKLEVLENELPVATTEGRGYSVLPLCALSSKNDPPTMAGADTSENKRDTTEVTPRKYVLQATVVRGSWRLADSAWPYISMIKSVDKLEEVKSGSDVKPGSAKKGRGKDKGTASRKGNHPQQGTQLDTSKPHWTVRIVTKTSEKDSLQVKKDTERADELRSMVQAWETEQPGRSKKAQQSRQKFLDAHAIKETSSSAPDEDQSTALSVQSEASTTVPRAPTGPVLLKQMDLSPFIVEAGGAQLLDEAEQALRLQERQTLFKEYKASRQAILQLRNADRELRNESKVEQLEQAEQWQANLDELRNKLNAGREAVRSKQLAKDRAKVEAEQAAVKTQEETAAGRESKTKGKAKGKKK